MISSRKADDGGLPREILGVDFSGAADAVMGGQVLQYNI
jgi:hypothetical protein